MINIEEIRHISTVSSSKIVMLVIDGLGGLPDPQTGKTELETAFTPNLDNLAVRSTCGLIDPVSPGITPGSGPGHLALFGYDPFRFLIGRGVLEGMGIDFDLKPSDVAARGNFCTIDNQGFITDRRAGRITTEKNAELCELLGRIRIGGVETFVSPVRDHRFLLVLRGQGLAPQIGDTDPQRIGVKPYTASASEPKSKHTANLINEFISEAKEILSNHLPANMITLRGFSRLPHIPSMKDVYKLKPAAIARYPMYKGLARLLGMELYDVNDGIEEALEILADCYSKHDFFYTHIKETDSAGEDGDFQRKVQAIERVDAALPKLLTLNPDVIIVTGDHSTPALLKGHSWHPVPILLSSKWTRLDSITRFSESACASGGLGRLPAIDIMPLAMANALKLTKYGA